MSLSARPPLLTLQTQGLYCEAGDFFVDPWRPVDRAVITHAHADHARSGHRHYLAATPGAGVLRARLGAISLQAQPYREPVDINGVRVSLHPAGHVLGSAQVRIEHRGEVWVVSGDYKLQPDPTCEAFEPVVCDTFVSESTFGLPIYRWAAPAQVFAEIDAWWAANAAAGRASVLYCYSFGKAQRILAGINASIGPIVCHGAIESLNRVYRAAGVSLPETSLLSDATRATTDRQALERQAPDRHAPDHQPLSRALVLAPPSAAGTSWLRRFPDPSDAFASGWMALRGARRRRACDRGFVLSDHADWPGLQQAIGESRAQRVFVTHGQVAVMVRWLGEQGIEAGALPTQFEGDEGEGDGRGDPHADTVAHAPVDIPVAAPRA